MFIQISPKIVTKGPTGSKSVLVQIFLINTGPVHWRIYVALGGDELTGNHRPRTWKAESTIILEHLEKTMKSFNITTYCSIYHFALM